MDTPDDDSQNQQKSPGKTLESKETKLIDIPQLINYLSTNNTNKQIYENTSETLLQEIINLGVLGESNNNKNLLDFHQANRCKSFENFFKFDADEKNQKSSEKSVSKHDQESNSNEKLSNNKK